MKLSEITLHPYLLLWQLLRLNPSRKTRAHGFPFTTRKSTHTQIASKEFILYNAVSESKCKPTYWHFQGNNNWQLNKISLASLNNKYKIVHWVNHQTQPARSSTFQMSCPLAFAAHLQSPHGGPSYHHQILFVSLSTCCTQWGSRNGGWGCHSKCSMISLISGRPKRQWYANIMTPTTSSL